MLSLSDSLTGLYNRRGLFALGEHTMRSARRRAKGLGLVFVDVDGLKDINSRFGHAQGDEALRAVADVIRASIRESDVVGRVGGDEFVVLAEDDPDVTRELAARLRRRVARANESRRGRSASVSASAPSTGSRVRRSPCRSSSSAPARRCTTTSGRSGAERRRPGGEGTMTQTKPNPDAGASVAPAAATAPPQDQWSPRVSAAMLARLAARAAVAAPAGSTQVEAPCTGMVLAEVPKGCAADVRAACEAARDAQREWARRSASARAAVLLRYHDLVLANAQEILDLIQLESGKARIHAFEEVLDVAIQARYYGHMAPQFLRPRRAQGALPVLTQARVHHRPRGVVGIIAPWNYPFTLAIGDALPALAAGNGVVLKPDALTPLTGLWAAGLLEEAGLPAGLLQVVTGRGSELGTPLIDGADFIMFTGSTATGRKSRSAVRRAAEELRHGARRQERTARAPRRAALARRARRRPGHHLQRRPAVHQHRACLRARRHLRRVRAASRRAAQGAAARGQPDVRRRHGLAHQRRPAGEGRGARGRRRGQGSRGAGGRQGPPRPRPVLLRAHAPGRRHRGHGAVPRRDLRPHRGPLPMRVGRRDGRARQRQSTASTPASGRATSRPVARSPAASRRAR